MRAECGKRFSILPHGPFSRPHTEWIKQILASDVVQCCRGRARTWCGKQRPKAVLPAPWPRSRTGVGPTGTGLYANSAPGGPRYSRPTTASRGIFGGYRTIGITSRGSGTRGWNVESGKGLGQLPSAPHPPFAAICQDHPPLHQMERSSRVRNRICESRSSGSEGARGQPPRLPDILVPSMLQFSDRRLIILLGTGVSRPIGRRFRDDRSEHGWHNQELTVQVCVGLFVAHEAAL
jgi:hypothetical protein